MKGVLVAILIVFVSPVFGQIKPKDLEGQWTACNKDSAYYKSEMLVLHQDANYYVEAKCCYYVNWQVTSKRKMRIENAHSCSEPGTVNFSTEGERFKIKNHGEEQLIFIERNGQQVDKFKIVSFEEKRVDRYPHEIKLLTLKRID